jgi:2-hydroxy-3-oxopropionate reductase
MTMGQRIAVIGAGLMGSAFVTRLLQCGHEIHVFDIDAAKRFGLAKLGAKPANSITEATKNSDFIVLSLNHADIVRKAVFDEHGIAGAASPEKLVIDMSSIDPAATVEIATQLFNTTGMRWVDCPLSGGVPGALLGKLTIMAGGDVADFERARIVMKDLAANYTLMGGLGAGQTTKLVNQLFCALAFQAVAEAVKLAEAGGVDATKIPAALSGGRADNRIMQEFMVKFANRDFTPTGSLNNMLKDLDSVQAFALKSKIPLPLTSAVTEIHRVLIAMGLGTKDNAEVMRFLDGNG